MRFMPIKQSLFHGEKNDFEGMDKNRNKIFKEILSVFWIRNDGGLD